jgi:heme exporter protein C
MSEFRGKMTDMERNRKLGLFAIVWLVATVAVIVYATRLALFVSPTDAAQGNVGRNFYYHVPHSMLSLLFPYINFVASLFYLYWRRRDPLKALTADAWAIASAEVTVVYASICLITGSIWGYAAWGIWWTWDARLTSMLLLWLLYVSYLMLRNLSSTGQTQTLAAVLSVFAAIDVPIVYMSIQWWRTQHPAPVFFGAAPGDGLDASMKPAFGWNVLGWAMWGLFLLAVRYALERRRQALEQEAALHAIEASLEWANEI